MAITQDCRGILKSGTHSPDFLYEDESAESDERADEMCNRAGEKDFRAWNSTECKAGDYAKRKGLLCYYWWYVSYLTMKILWRYQGD